jgi:hypothetical protein
MNTPKAFANSNPGSSIARTLGHNFKSDQTLKRLDRCRTLSGFNDYLVVLIPGLSLRSNPGLKLANAFGVFVQFKLG